MIRENTEGLYAGMGGFFKKGTADEIATQEDINTRKGVERILRYAFEFARRRGYRRVCMSDKSNALAYGHNLWTRVFAEVRGDYPEIEASHMYIDNLLLQMVRDPAQFQVIVTCNLFGDIASDLGAALIGGLGIAPSGNIHPGRVSLFEPVHGSAPDIAGEEYRESDGSGAGGGDDVYVSRLDGRGAGHRRRGARRDSRGQDDLGSRRLTHHATGRRLARR